MTYHDIVCRIAPALRQRRPHIYYWSKIRVCRLVNRHLMWED